MQAQPSSGKTVAFFLTISIFGLFTVVALAMIEPAVHTDYFWRKPLVGVLFSTICIAGVAAAFHPNKCAEKFETQEVAEASPEDRPTNYRITGHHPNCARYGAHTLTVSKHVFCAACSGLALGAFVAVLGMVLYVSGGDVSVEAGKLMLIVGSICVPLGLAQLKLSGGVRLMLNFVFVCGAFLVLIGTDVLIKDTLLDLYIVGLIVVWIMTRIVLSDWDHSRICGLCRQKCGMRRSELVS